MDKNKAIEKVNELKAQIAELQKIIEAPPRWRAEKGTEYWLVGSGGVYDDIEGGDEIDDYRHRIGNYFKTKEQAQEWKDWHDTICELRAFSDGLDGWWVIYKDSQDDGYNVLRFEDEGCLPHIRFSTKERAEEAIKHFGSRLDLIYR